jgi:hypothetical protein
MTIEGIAKAVKGVVIFLYGSLYALARCPFVPHVGLYLTA